MVILQGAGSFVIIHVFLTAVTRVRLWLDAVVWSYFGRNREESCPLLLWSIARFLRVLRFTPVVTMDPWGVALTGPLGRITLVADRVIQYKRRHIATVVSRVIEFTLRSSWISGRTQSRKCLAFQLMFQHRFSFFLIFTHAKWFLVSTTHWTHGVKKNYC